MKRATVQTVLGELPAEQLGATLSHEHVLAAPPGFESDSTLKLDREASLLHVTGELRKLKEHGVSSIIDPIPMDLGRDVNFLADASRQSSVNIICATGLYLETGRLGGLLSHYMGLKADILAGVFLEEIHGGIGPEKIKPGVIKCATSAHEITRGERKALTAAAWAAKDSGIPITTHTQEASMGPEQLDIFEENGVDPRRVTVGHCSDSSDLAYLVKILKRGAYVGFDRVGIERMTEDEVKVGAIAALVAMGFEKQIVLSHDNVECAHGFEPTGGNPKRRYTFIPEEFIPALKAAGLSEDAIHTILVDNPRRYFEGPD